MYRKPRRGVITINSLPTELLASVFRLQPLDEHNSRKVTLYRTTLRLVCRRWNEIVITDARIWSNILIDIHLPPIPLVIVWLRRSAHVPLEILVIEEPPYGHQIRYEALQKYLSDVFSVLIRHIERWQELTLHVRPRFSKLLPTLPLDRAYRLEALDLDIDHTCSDQISSRIIHMFETAPAIHRLALRCGNTQLPLSKMLIHPTSTLLGRSVQLRLQTLYASLPDILTIMRKCEFATHIDIGFALKEGVGSLACGNFVSLQHLHTLSLRSQMMPYEIFRCFHLPNLRVLDCHHTGHSRNVADIGALQWFLQRSGHSLQILRLDDIRISQDHLLSLITDPHLLCVPTVEIITLRIDQAFKWRMLYSVGDRSVYCEELEGRWDPSSVTGWDCRVDRYFSDWLWPLDNCD